MVVVVVVMEGGGGGNNPVRAIRQAGVDVDGF